MELCFGDADGEFVELLLDAEYVIYFLEDGEEKAETIADDIFFEAHFDAFLASEDKLWYVSQVNSFLLQSSGIFLKFVEKIKPRNNLISIDILYIIQQLFDLSFEFDYQLFVLQFIIELLV